MKKAFRKMLAVLMALTMIVANFAIIAVNAEEGHAHAEEVKCPGVGEEHTKTNCDWTEGKTVAPTETKQGYTTFTCDVCKAPFLADFLPALGHTKHVYGDPKTVEPADCTTDGYVYVECTVDGCDENIEGHTKKLKDIPAPGHEMVVDGKGCKCVNCDEKTQVKHTYEVKSFTAPTAEAQGKATLECTNCGDVQVDVPVSKICDETHVWVEKQYTTPDCDTEGSTRHIYCATCDDCFFKEVVPALGHTWDDGVYESEDKKPTCLEKGEKLFTCTVCGDTKKEEVATGEHSTIVPEHGYQAPTCLMEGWKIHYCTVCKTVVDEEIFKKLPHDYDYDNDNDVDADDITAGIAAQKVTKVDPTCTDAGSITYLCDHCGVIGKKTETLPATGHTEATHAAQAATCDEYGWTAGVYCTVCSGYTADANAEFGATATWLTAPTKIDALGHEYTKDAGTPAYCSKVSESWKACVRCNKPDPNGTIIKGNTYDPNNHLLGREVLVAPTCTKEGLDKVWCTLCGENDLPDEKTAPTGHKFDAGKVLAGDEPTCTEKGWTTYTCTNANCDGCTTLTNEHTAHTEACKSYKVQNVDAKGHAWGDLTKEGEFVKLDETCCADGYIAAICGVCKTVATAKDGEKAYQPIPKDPAKYHVRNQAYWEEELRAPTCVLVGLDRYHCDICGEDYTKQTENLGPCVNPEKVDPADYEKLFCDYATIARRYPDGIAHCAACGAYYKVTKEASTDPNVQTGYKEVLTKLTLTGENPDLILHALVEHEAQHYDCMTTGWDAYVDCSKCDYTTKVTKIGLGHNYISGTGANAALNVYETVEADCDDFGYTVVYCFDCDQLVIVDYVAPLGHTYGTGNDAITGIFSCKDERLQKALEGTGVKHAICSVAGCGKEIHDIEYRETVYACDGEYNIYFCTNYDECGYVYSEVVEVYDVKLHDDENFDEATFIRLANGEPNLKTPATATKGNVWEAECKYCGEMMTYVDDEIVDELYFDYNFYAANEDFEIFDPIYVEFGPQPLMANNVGGFYWNMPITNGGIVAVVITTNSPGVEVNSIGLKLEYDATRLEFIGGEVTNDKFNLSNCRVSGNNKVGENVYATLTVLAVTEDGGIGLSGEEELAVAYFRVLTNDGDDDPDYELWINMWDSERSEVLDEDGEDVSFEVEEVENDRAIKLGDLTFDNRIGLGDLNEMALMIDLDYEGEYLNFADINRDGVVDIFDYELLVDYYLELIDYLEFCGK